jgi:hypothetical protein
MPKRKVLLLTCALLLPACAAQAQQDRWIGRWYVPLNAGLCKAKAGGAEGLLVYTAKHMFGMENRCRILSTVRKGTKAELKMRCRGEGETSEETETLEVVGGRLQRTVTLDGKAVTFSYNRCP